MSDDRRAVAESAAVSMSRRLEEGEARVERLRRRFMIGYRWIWECRRLAVSKSE